jgi:hypothetical protein
LSASGFRLRTITRRGLCSNSWPTVLFLRTDPQAQRLDHFLQAQEASLPVDHRLTILRQAADVTLRYEVEDFLARLDEIEDELTHPATDWKSPLEAVEGDHLQGGFTVLRKLGGGAVAVVLSVERGGEELVLKVSRKPEYNARLSGEFRILKERLRWPTIVNAHHLPQFGDLTGFTMELAIAVAKRDDRAHHKNRVEHLPARPYPRARRRGQGEDRTLLPITPVLNRGPLSSPISGRGQSVCRIADEHATRPICPSVPYRTARLSEAEAAPRLAGVGGVSGSPVGWRKRMLAAPVNGAFAARQNFPRNISGGAGVQSIGYEEGSFSPEAGGAVIGIYSDRTPGGYRHHWNSHLHALAGIGGRQRLGQADRVCEPGEAIGLGSPDVCQR